MISLLFLIFYSLINPMIMNCSELTALNHSPHSLQLYQNLRKEGAVPTDEAISLIPEIQNRICKEINESKFFSSFGVFIDSRNVFRSLRRFRSRSVPQNLNQSASSLYVKRNFKIFGSSDVEEHVFPCLIVKFGNAFFIPIYVSKEYNVGSFGQPYMAGRFIFVNFEAEGDVLSSTHNGTHHVILAEEPASRVFSESDFDVELHYLEMRKDVPLAESNETDPLCKLISNNADDPDNQYQRLCVAVSRSLVVKDRVDYPQEKPMSCAELRVSFRTADTRGKAYKERMTLCPYRHRDPQEPIIFMFISRAYKSNQIFVYRGEYLTKRIYLEYLLTNVDIKDSGSSFNFIAEEPEKTFQNLTSLE